MKPPAKTTATTLLAAAVLTVFGCGGGSGVTAAQAGLQIEALADVKLSKEIAEMGQGNPPYGATIGRTLRTENVDGVWVSAIRRGSPAAEAGLGPGDLITTVDGDDVTTPAEVDDALDGADAGSAVEIEGLYVASGDATQFLDRWSTQVELPE